MRKHATCKHSSILWHARSRVTRVLACAHLHTLADKCTNVHTHSNYEKVVMELREGSAAKDAEIVELQKKLEKLSS
jgi:hypothetical protein